MKSFVLLIWAILLAIPVTASADDDAARAAVGGAIGGAVGGLVGSQVGGKDGAVVGAGIGAATGAAIATDDNDSRQRRDTTAIRVRHGSPRATHCPPGLAKQGRC